MGRLGHTFEKGLSWLTSELKEKAQLVRENPRDGVIKDPSSEKSCQWMFFRGHLTHCDTECIPLTSISKLLSHYIGSRHRL